MERHDGSMAQERQLMTGAQALVRALEDVGVTDIFGMPGGAINTQIGRASCRERV